MSAFLTLLDQGIEAQQAQMRAYEVESETATLETVRSLDYVYFKDLIPELQSLSYPTQEEVTIMQWGVNEALHRVLPKSLGTGTPRIHASNPIIQKQADGFIFNAGVLAMAKRQRLLLAQGLLKGSVDPRQMRGFQLLVLDAVDLSVYSDAIGRAGMAWLSSLTQQQDRTVEAELERRHMEILPRLEEYIADKDYGSIKPPADLENHFYQWAQIYLRRMAYRDLLADDDIIGGYPYERYVAALTAISSMCQMRICCACLLHSNDPNFDIRNALTGFILLKDLHEYLARFLNTDEREIADLLKNLMLSPENHSKHLGLGTPAWAPVIRSSEHLCILPSYGLDINPFLFLLHELRTSYEKDWFRLANRREERWVRELEELFPSFRWKYANGTKLKRDSKVVTDIDFIAYDCQTRQLALFQLKWQQPALADEKMRRSNGANLVDTSNKWIQDVQGWIEEFGINALLDRSKLHSVAVADVSFFVIARYSAYFPTDVKADTRATWSDWGHLCKHRHMRPEGSVHELREELHTDLEKQQFELQPASVALPLPGLALTINPIKRPDFMKR